MRERGLMAPLRRIFALAVPSIITNITTPLLGLVDLAVVGHMGGDDGGSAPYIAAIAVGGSMFNMLYWLFVFLRMGTSGPTAQAIGGGDRKGAVLILARALTVAVSSGIIIVLLSRPLGELTMRFMDPDPTTQPMAMQYLLICVWGAPAVLGTYALTGWFLGMQDSRSPMWVSLAINLLNIAVSLVLVYGIGMKIAGVATGTLSAQWLGFIIAVAICVRKYSPHLPTWHDIIKWSELRKFFSVNSDIFLRTLCLVAVTMWFTRAGASQGDVMLAVNSLLMQLFILFSFFLDGFAFAGESLCGFYYGMKDSVRLRQIVKLEFLCTGILAMAFSTFYFLCGQSFLTIISSDSDVLDSACEYLPWAATVPLAGFVAFTYDAICIGTTRTRQMLWSGFLAALGFFILYFSLFSILGNHALWLAFIIYLALRGITLRVMLTRSRIYEFVPAEQRQTYESDDSKN